MSLESAIGLWKQSAYGRDRSGAPLGEKSVLKRASSTNRRHHSRSKHDGRNLCSQSSGGVGTCPSVLHRNSDPVGPGVKQTDGRVSSRRDMLRTKRISCYGLREHLVHRQAYPGFLTGRDCGVRGGPICSFLLLDDARHRLWCAHGIVNRLLCLAPPLVKTPGYAGNDGSPDQSHLSLRPRVTGSALCRLSLRDPLYGHRFCMRPLIFKGNRHIPLRRSRLSVLSIPHLLHPFCRSCAAHELPMASPLAR